MAKFTDLKCGDVCRLSCGVIVFDHVWRPGEVTLIHTAFAFGTPSQHVETYKIRQAADGEEYITFIHAGWDKVYLYAGFFVSVPFCTDVFPRGERKY